MIVLAIFFAILSIVSLLQFYLIRRYLNWVWEDSAGMAEIPISYYAAKVIPYPLFAIGYAIAAYLAWMFSRSLKRLTDSGDPSLHLVLRAQNRVCVAVVIILSILVIQRLIDVIYVP